MGTILNMCKEARKLIVEVENGMNEAVIAWKQLEDGHKEVAIFYPDKAKEIRDNVLELKGKLENIDCGLQKNSKVRPYYEAVYSRCIDFLDRIERG